MRTRTQTHHVSLWLLIACGYWLMSLGFYFIFMRPALLPEDTRFMGSSLDQVRALFPGLEGWLKRVFIVMAGLIAGTGALTIFTARTTISPRLTGASWAIAISGSLTVALMSSINFALHSDFRWLLLVPVLGWLAGFVIYILRR